MSMKILKLTDTTVEWIIEQGQHLVDYAMEGVDGEPSILDRVRPDSPLYRFVASTVMFIRSLVGIARNVPMIEE